MMKQLRRMMLVGVAVATMVSCATFTGSAAARGAPRIPKLTKVWSQRLVGPGTAPVVDNGTVFVSASASIAPRHGAPYVVYAVDAVCPPAPARCVKHLLWKHGYASPTIALSPAGAGSGDVYVGISDYGAGGNVGGPEQALSETSGSTVFSSTTSQAGLGAAVATGGHVYVTWGAQVLGEDVFTGTEALNGASGTSLFTTTIGSGPDIGSDPYSQVDGPTTGPTVAGDNLFVGYGSSIDAFDATGTTDCGPEPHSLSIYVSFPEECAALWSGATGGTLTGTPVVAGGEVYVGASNGVLYAFPEAGCGSSVCAPDWTANIGGSITSAVAASGTTVFVGSSNGMLEAFPVGGCGFSTCPAEWSADVGGSVSGPAVAGSLVYAASTNDRLDAFDAAGCGYPTCTASWQANVRQPIDTAPAVANGVIFVSDAHHSLHAYRAP